VGITGIDRQPDERRVPDAPLLAAFILPYLGLKKYLEERRD